MSERLSRAYREALEKKQAKELARRSKAEKKVARSKKPTPKRARERPRQLTGVKIANIKAALDLLLPAWEACDDPVAKELAKPLVDRFMTMTSRVWPRALHAKRIRDRLEAEEEKEG